MTTYFANVAVDMSPSVQGSFFVAGPGSVLSATSTLIQLATPTGGYQEYLGSFSYTYSGGYQYLYWPGSTLTGLKSYDSNWSLLSSATGMNIPGSTYEHYVNSNDVGGLVAFAMRDNDTIAGSSYGDVLYGYAGNDTLTGGAGSDVFLFSANGNGNDTITDFTFNDAIRLTGANLVGAVSPGNGSAVGLNQVQFSAAAGFTTLYVGTDTIAGADAVIRIQSTLTASDLRLVDDQIVLNHSPTLAVSSAPTFIDTSADDTFLTATGTLSGADVDVGTTLTYGISGGTNQSTTVTKTGIYGVLAVTKATGAYTYTPNDAAIEGIKATATDSFTVQVSDGAATTNAAFTVNLSGANDAPILTLADSDMTLIEDGAGVPIFAGLSITDADDPHIYSAHLQIDGWQSAGDVISFTEVIDMSVIDINTLGDPLTATFIGPKTLASFLTTLQGIQISSTTDALAGNRTVHLTISDGTTSTELAPFVVATQGVNDSASAAITPAGNLSLTAGGALTPYASLSLTDPDTPNLTGASITLVGAATGDLLAVATGGTGIVSQFAGGVLTLSGSASLATYQGVLGTLAFQGTQAGSRTLELRIDDGNGVGLPSSLDVSVVPGAPTNADPKGHDYNADGKTDILWQNSSTGALYSYQMNGQIIQSEGYITQSAPSGWTVIGSQGDYNGDGKSDILWHNAGSNSVYTYLMNGSVIQGEGMIAQNVPAGWNILGSQGDYNGDGKADILWKNTSSNATYIYLMDGTTVAGEGYERFGIGAGWDVRESAADYNGDGKSDLLWQNSISGALYIDQINGTGIQSEGFVIQSGPAGWTVIDGKSDLNGDGKSDILWHNAGSNSVYAYLMNGSGIQTEGMIAQNVPAGWNILESQGDYNGDGKSDILWKNTNTNATYIYLMDGVTIQGQGYERFGIGAGWDVADAKGDYNGDGKSDILWKNSISGDVYLDQVNGTTIQSEGMVAQGVAAGWVVA